MRSGFTLGLLVVALLAGCAATPAPTPEPTPSSTEQAEIVTPDELVIDVEVPPACLESVRAGQGPVGPDGVEPVFREVLGSCGTAAELVTALRLVNAENPPPNPAAEDVFVGLIVICLNSMDLGIESAICSEAEDKGWLDDLPANDPTVTHPKPGTD